MRTDWFSDLTVPGRPRSSPPAGDAENRGVMRSSPASPPVPGHEQEAADSQPAPQGTRRDQRAMVAFRLAEAPERSPVVIGAPGEIGSGELFDAYRQWAAESGVHRTLTHKSFAERIERLGYEKRRTRTGRVFNGLRLSATATACRAARDGL